MTPALYTPTQVVVKVIQDGDELAYVKFPGGKVLWVKSNLLDFDDLVGGDDWGPDDCMADAGDLYDIEYDR